MSFKEMHVGCAAYFDECKMGSDNCDRTEVCMESSCVSLRLGVCSNTEGSFQCSCGPGFRGDDLSCLGV